MHGFLDSRRLRLLWTALVYIAADAEPVSGKELTARLDCSRRYLEADLQALAQNALLESRRGAKGGYRLARAPQRITLLDVLRCLESEIASQEAVDCPVLKQVVMPQLKQAHVSVTKVLETTTLADALALAEAAGLLTVPVITGDFCI